MLLQIVVRQERVETAELFGQRHFIMTPVDASMAATTDINACVELVAGEVVFEVRAAMELFRDEVVEGQCYLPTAAGALTGPLLHSKSSIIPSSRTLSGATLLLKCSTTLPSRSTRYLLKFHVG